MHLLVTLAFSTLYSGGFHVPHDPVDDVAVGPNFRTGTGYEIVLCQNASAKVSHSYDEGLTWEVVGGDKLQQFHCTQVEYFPNLVRPLYFIGTTDGVWTYDPQSGEVLKTIGMPANDDFVTSLSAPANGVGGVLVLTKHGNVYAWDISVGSWFATPIYSFGQDDDFGQVKMVSAFNPGSPDPRRKTIIASVNGLVMMSQDAGQNWTEHATLSQQANGPTDWSISAIAFSREFLWDGTILVGRSRENSAAGTPIGDEGELWRSTDGGVTFNLQKTFISRITSIHSTKAGPASTSGLSHFYLSIYYYPDAGDPNNLVGILRSDDGGLSWDDFGNWQDFFLEVEVAEGAASRWKPLMGFAEAPDFQTTGLIYFGRSEGLFRSRDSGNHWIQTRTRNERYVRQVDVGIDSNGDIMAFGGCYGSGTLWARFNGNDGQLIGSGVLGTLSGLSVIQQSKVTFQKPIVVSPNFASDGTVAIGGASGLAIWLDPTKGANPFYNNLEGWIETTVNPFTYIRSLAMSPHFDSSDPSGDHTIVASTRSELGGLGESAFLLLEGGKNPIEVNDAYVPSNPSGQQYLPVRHLSSIAIAPTFDSSATAGLLDIYGTAGPNLFRLDFDVNAPNGSGYVWTWLGEHPSTGLITALVVDPSWSRSPSSPYPVLWATTVDSPYILRITDNGGSAATFDMVDTVGMDSFVRGLALSHSFANDNTLYVSTSGTGVHKLDVGPFLARSSSALQWNRVGKDYPPYLSLPLGSAVTGLGADLLITGTEVGFAYGSDNPNQAWQTIATDSSVDDLDPGFTTYSPRNPSNTQGYRPWPWSTIDADYVERTRKVETHGGTVTFVRDNGAWFHWEGLARELTLEAIGGPGMGKVDLELFDLKTGALINSMLGVDLNASFFENRPITITGTANQAVYLDVHARLQGGKTFAFDGLIVKH